MKVGTDTIVNLTYTFDADTPELPAQMREEYNIQFLFGRERVLPALEKTIAGLSENDSFSVIIPCQEAFGEYDPSLVNEIPISAIQDVSQLKKGTIFEGTGPGGRPIAFMVKEVKSDTVMADFNHPAAGKDITLSGKINEVRAASFLDILAAMKLTGHKGGG